MKILLYTLPYRVSDETNKINKLFNEGLEELHIRKPLYSINQLRRFIKQIEVQYHSKIVIHNHYSLIREFDLKGIHVKQSYFNNLLGKIIYFLKHKNRKYKISVSIDPLRKTKINTAYFDEVSIGPIYQKFSESNLRKRVNYFELNRIVSSLKVPFNFFGGISQDNLGYLNTMKPNGIILQTGIWKSANLLNAFSSFEVKKNSLNGTKKVSITQNKTAL